MIMLSLTENERAWIEFLRLISGDTDPVPDLQSIQALRLTLGRRRSEIAHHASVDPDFRNQGAPFPSPASADPTTKPRMVTASRDVTQSSHRGSCPDQGGTEGNARD